MTDIHQMGNPAHKQKAIYRLTGPSIALVPNRAARNAPEGKWPPVGEEPSIRVRVPAVGHPERWDRFMAALRPEHLGIPAGLLPLA